MGNGGYTHARHGRAAPGHHQKRRQQRFRERVTLSRLVDVTRFMTPLTGFLGIYRHAPPLP